METKKCEKSENTLMRKTKKELVEIILRKDDVEIKLKDQVRELTEDRDTLQRLSDNLEVTVNDQQAHLDDAAVDVANALESTKRWKRVAIIAIVAFVVVAVLAIVL